MSEKDPVFQKDPTLRDGETNARMRSEDEAHGFANEVDYAETDRANARFKLNLAATALEIDRIDGPDDSFGYLYKKDKEYEATHAQPYGKGINSVNTARSKKVHELRNEYQEGNWSSRTAGNNTYTREDAVRNAIVDYTEADEEVKSAYQEAGRKRIAKQGGLPELDEEFGLEQGTLKKIN